MSSFANHEPFASIAAKLAWLDRPVEGLSMAGGCQSKPAYWPAYSHQYIHPAENKNYLLSAQSFPHLSQGVPCHCQRKFGIIPPPEGVWQREIFNEALFEVTSLWGSLKRSKNRRWQVLNKIKSALKITRRKMQRTARQMQIDGLMRLAADMRRMLRITSQSCGGGKGKVPWS